MAGETSSFFMSECADIVERARVHGAVVKKIAIEGIYKGEIFEIKYVPKEEGYNGEEGE